MSVPSFCRKGCPVDLEEGFTSSQAAPNPIALFPPARLPCSVAADAEEAAAEVLS